jgi:hypothetical protein|tara:strand:+ start:86 stop:337 length:252 start_codon:yes stop_codon:yes gene_type:complete
MTRAKYRSGVSKDKRFDAKIKGLCVETKPSQIITFYAYKSVHMHNKKKNKWAPNVVYRKMWHWAQNTSFDCESVRDKVGEYIN